MLVLSHWVCFWLLIRKKYITLLICREEEPWIGPWLLMALLLTTMTTSVLVPLHPGRSSACYVNRVACIEPCLLQLFGILQVYHDVGEVFSRISLNFTIPLTCHWLLLNCCNRLVPLQSSFQTWARCHEAMRPLKVTASGWLSLLLLRWEQGFFVKKKDGTLWPCIDNRALN